VNEELKVLIERAEGVKKRLSGLEAERSELAAPIESQTMDLYTRLFTKKPDAAVVPLEHGICGGCHMKVVSGTIQQLRSEEIVTQCESCGRILYLVE
jgi:predicted  nucleic acid-binding Zn-ribbon protein